MRQNLDALSQSSLGFSEEGTTEKYQENHRNSTFSRFASVFWVSLLLEVKSTSSIDSSLHRVISCFPAQMMQLVLLTIAFRVIYHTRQLALVNFCMMQMRLLECSRFMTIRSLGEFHDRQLLKYSIVYSFLGCIEHFSRTLMNYLTFYWLAKCIFLVRTWNSTCFVSKKQIHETTQPNGKDFSFSD
jgi:hypothetical protein